MTKASGRLALIKKNAVTIGGLLNTSVTVNGSPVNVEDKSDGGWETHLDGVLTGQSVEITGEGYEEDQVLRDLAFGAAAGKFLSDLTFEFGNGSNTISGDFTMTSYSETGEKDDGIKFNVTFRSNGTVTYA